jgi:hypothetical protein
MLMSPKSKERELRGWVIPTLGANFKITDNFKTDKQGADAGYEQYEQRYHLQQY